MFYCNQRRRLNSNNLYEDIWSDPIIDILGKDEVIAIENPFNLGHLKPAQTDNIYYTDFILIFIVIITKLLLIFYKVFNKKKFIEVEYDFNKEFSIKIPIRRIALNVYVKRIVSRKGFRILFRFLRPQIIFLVCSYGKEDIIEAAKDIKIKTIEIQHGVITPFHLGYSFHNGAKKRSFPDYLFTFGDYWKKRVELPISKQNIFNVGFPYINKALIHYSKVKKIDQIVFLSQGTTGKYIASYAVMISKNIDNINIIYKLHPGEYSMWEELYPELHSASLNGVLTVVKGESSTLYNLLSESKWQVGVNSTALFEGLAFNCQTFILKCTGYEYMQDLIDSELVTLIEHEESLVENLFYDRIDIDREFFFKGNHEESIRKVVKFIIGNI